MIDADQHLIQRRRRLGLWWAQRWPDTYDFWRFLRSYIFKRGYLFFSYTELVKDLVVGILYKRRGKFARPFLHTALMSVLFIGITFGPLVVSQATADESVDQQTQLPSGVLRTFSGDTPFLTQSSEEVVKLRGGEVVDHVVQDGETLSSIAQKYNLQVDTITSENNLSNKVTLQVGQHLRILPADGVQHKVQKGETVYSIAQKYGLGSDKVAAQAIITFPFNTFANDETFALSIGQYVFVPGGVKPSEDSLPRTVARITTPNAGAVSATGKFVWPASGMITQSFFWYHKALDIANHGGGPILAADAGRVIVAGWVDNTGYGNRVMIDHGNGFVTLYGHMSVVRVQVGQTVNRGDQIGDMGSTGRSTGTHLHFEIRTAAGAVNPLDYLR
jgi:murein DD-endopeptidase MepM/ murein hydrolase activator NlpD